MNATNPIASPIEETERQPGGRILAVDDDRVMLMMLTQLLEDMGHTCLQARNGREACEFLSKEQRSLDVVLLDREMPEMDGLEVVQWLKNQPDMRNLPVIMQTGSDKPEQIKEGIDAGVFYYLTKPYDESVLESVLYSAMRETSHQRVLRSEMLKHKTSFNLMANARFSFRTLQEAEDLSCFLANCFPEPDRVVGGLGELFINAVEHGNLAIGYDAKTDLIRGGTWREEIARRLDLPENTNKRVRVTFERGETEIAIVIRDEGPGFEWRNFLQINPARAMDNHGRGIAQANLYSLDRLEFNELGNEVRAVVDLQEELDW